MFGQRRRHKRKIRHILIYAATLIEVRGWCQNYYFNSEGNLCMLGAVEQAIKANDCDFLSVYLEIRNILFENLGGFASVWNDAPGRTKEEVVAKLREVANNL